DLQKVLSLFSAGGCIYNLFDQKKEPLCRKRLQIAAVGPFCDLALRCSSLGRSAIMRSLKLVSGVTVVSICGHIGRLSISSSSSWDDSALTIMTSLMAPSAGPPARIFSSSSSFLHSSRLVKMYCSIKEIPYWGPPVGRP